MSLMCDKCSHREVKNKYVKTHGQHSKNNGIEPSHKEIQVPCTKACIDPPSKRASPGIRTGGITNKLAKVVTTQAPHIGGKYAVLRSLFGRQLIGSTVTRIMSCIMGDMSATNA